MSLTPIEQATIGVYLLGAFVLVFGLAFTLWVARPFRPWTKEERPDVPAE
jgi:hypothetical protein